MQAIEWAYRPHGHYLDWISYAFCPNHGVSGNFIEQNHIPIMVQVMAVRLFGESVLTSYQLDPWEQMWLSFESISNNIHTGNWIWKMAPTLSISQCRNYTKATPHEYVFLLNILPALCAMTYPCFLTNIVRICSQVLLVSYTFKKYL